MYVPIGILFICIAKMKYTQYNYTLVRTESFPCYDNGYNFYLPINSSSVWAYFGTINLEGNSPVEVLPKYGDISFKGTLRDIGIFLDSY